MSSKALKNKYNIGDEVWLIGFDYNSIHRGTIKRIDVKECEDCHLDSIFYDIAFAKNERVAVSTITRIEFEVALSLPELVTNLRNIKMQQELRDQEEFWKCQDRKRNKFNNLVDIINKEYEAAKKEHNNET